MGVDKSIERRLGALEKKYPLRKLDFRGVSTEDLEALERAQTPGSASDSIAPTLSKRLVRLIAKLEAAAAQ